jgi:hypothetical protein
VDSPDSNRYDRAAVDGASSTGNGGAAGAREHNHGCGYNSGHARYNCAEYSARNNSSKHAGANEFGFSTCESHAHYDCIGRSGRNGVRWNGQRNAVRVQLLPRAAVRKREFIDNSNRSR